MNDLLIEENIKKFHDSSNLHLHSRYSTIAEM